MKRILTLTAGLFALCLTFSMQAQVNLTFTINTPGGISGQIDVGPPADAFGGNLLPGESISGDLAISLADDDTGMLNDSLLAMGCDSLINADAAGNIALIQRGSCCPPTVCYFSDKVHNAEISGAIAAVICNHTPGEGAITMGSAGDWAGLTTIPSGFISWEDCQTIIAAIEGGDVVNVTMSVPAFYNEISSYSYHTPQSQILDLEDIAINLVNTSGDDAFDVDVTCTITDPNGVETVLVNTIEEFQVGVDSALSFDTYIPSDVGEYTLLFENSLNDDTAEEKFVITEDLFALDRNENIGSAGPSDAQFANMESFRYYYGSLYQTGEGAPVATHCVFGLSNAADIIVGDPQYDIINVVLYDGDADDDDVLDWADTGSSFEDLTPVAIGVHIITGTEGTDELLTVELTDFLGQPYQMKDNGAYYISIQYNGDVEAAPSAPAFLSTDEVNYLNFPTTPLFLEILYSGWTGETGVIRLQVAEAVGTEDLTALDDTQVTVSPNPTSDLVNLELTLENPAENVMVTIVNLDGRTLMQREMENVLSGTWEFNISDLPTGLYFMNVYADDNFRALPITVIR